MPETTDFVFGEVSPITGLTQKVKPLSLKANNDPFEFGTLPQTINPPINIDMEDYKLNETLPFGTQQGYDDVRADRQSKFSALGNAIVSRSASIPVKVLQMFGGIGGLLKYGYDFSQIPYTGIKPSFEEVYNNKVMQVMSQADQELKDKFPVYATHDYNESFLGKIGTEKFWTEDLFDGLAFLGAAYVTGGVGMGLTKLGVSRGISMGLGTAGNVIGESAIESKDTYDTIYQQLTELGYDDATAKMKAANAAKGTFFANLPILALSNSFEMRMMYGSADQGFLKLARQMQRGEVSIADIQSFKSILGKNVGEGIVKEGLWEEGMQNAVQQWEQRRAQDKELPNDFLGGVMNEWVKGWSDLEGQSSMLLGALIGTFGAGYGSYGEHASEKEKYKAADDFQKKIDFFAKQADNTFLEKFFGRLKKDDTGKYELRKGKELQEDGSFKTTHDPIIDTEYARKEFLQAIFDHQHIAHSINAIMSSDNIAKAFSDHDIFARHIFGYLTNPLFESTSQAIEEYKKDRKEGLDKILAETTDKTEKSEIQKNYNSSLMLADEIKDSWDKIEKEVGDTLDLYGTSTNKQGRRIVKKALLLSESKRILYNKLRKDNFGKDSFLADLDKLEEENNALYNYFSNKKTRNEYLIKWGEDNQTISDTQKKLEEYEKKINDNTITKKELKDYHKLDIQYKIDIGFDGLNYLTNIGNLNADKKQYLEDIDHIGAKNNYYYKLGRNERVFMEYDDKTRNAQDTLTNNQKKAKSLYLKELKERFPNTSNKLLNDIATLHSIQNDSSNVEQGMKLYLSINNNQEYISNPEFKDLKFSDKIQNKVNELEKNSKETITQLFNEFVEIKNKIEQAHDYNLSKENYDKLVESITFLIQKLNAQKDYELELLDQLQTLEKIIVKKIEAGEDVENNSKELQTNQQQQSFQEAIIEQIGSYINFLTDFLVEPKEKYINKNVYFQNFEKAQGKNDSFKTLYTATFLKQAVQYEALLFALEEFRKNPDQYDDINKINKIINRFGSVLDFLKGKTQYRYRKLYKELEA